MTAPKLETRPLTRPATATEAHAELCPVCAGSGKVASAYQQDAHRSTCPPDFGQVCHGCSGLGWVAVTVRVVGSNNTKEEP